MHASHDSGHLPQFTAFGHIFSAILQVTAAIEQGGNDGRWAKLELEPRMRQKKSTLLYVRKLILHYQCVMVEGRAPEPSRERGS